MIYQLHSSAVGLTLDRLRELACLPVDTLIVIAQKLSQTIVDSISECIWREVESSFDTERFETVEEDLFCKQLQQQHTLISTMENL